MGTHGGIQWRKCGGCGEERRLGARELGTGIIVSAKDQRGSEPVSHPSTVLRAPPRRAAPGLGACDQRWAGNEVNACKLRVPGGVVRSRVLPASVERELTDGWRRLRIGPPLNKNQECKSSRITFPGTHTYPGPRTTPRHVCTLGRGAGHSAAEAAGASEGCMSGRSSGRSRVSGPGACGGCAAARSALRATQGSAPASSEGGESERGPALPGDMVRCWAQTGCASVPSANLPEFVSARLLCDP